MTPARYQKISKLVHAALELEPQQQVVFLDAACAGDEELRHEVESLIASDEQAGSLFATPALEVAAGMMAAQQAHSAAGRKIGHYQIISLLGTGGMGEVYLAQDTRLGRQIALKLLPQEFTTDRERVARFEQEARAASALNHPNIITIFEIGQVDGTHYIATEFIDGQTLRHLMKTTQIKLREVLEIMIQAASALAAAHEAGIAHRDIKPENIMLRRDGYVKVLDFGLAKLTEKRRAGQAAETEAATRKRINTTPGVVMGTVTYMSPEQARGEEVDSRTDIFSLGVVLYEMVTGRAPFEGGTAGEILAQILEREPPPLQRYTREAPAELERIVMKALRKDREERYQTIKDVQLDLKSLREEEFQAKLERAVRSGSNGDLSAAPTDETAAARTTSSAEYLLSGLKQHKRGIALGLAALLLIGAGLTFWLSQFIGQRQARPGNLAQPVSPLQTMQMVRLTTTGKVTTAAISPDGKYVAYAMLDDLQQSLWLRQVANTSNVQIVPPAEAGYSGLTFSPDSNYLYYVKSGALYQVPIPGGIARKLIANVTGSVTLSPDGRQLAFVREDPSQGEAVLMRASADGSEEQKLATRKQPSQINAESAAWSPGGEMMAFGTQNFDASGQLNSAYETVVAVRVADLAEITISAQRWQAVPNLAWLSDGSGLLMIALDQDSVRGSPLQVWRLSYPSGEARKITNDFHDHSSVSLTADSRTLITVQEERLINLWVTQPGGPDLAHQVLSKAWLGRSTHELSWTRDGKIVYPSFASGNWDIWITDSNGSNQTQLTVAPSLDYQPSVSPDGRYIVFSSFRTGAFNIWRMDPDGANPKRLTSGSWDQTPDCSPDGNWVVYSSTISGKRALWKVVMDGGTPVQLTNKYSSAQPFRLTEN